MPQSSSEVAPIEIWQYILQESISFDWNLALEATCAPETYLAFKRTCRYGSYYPPMASYIRSEGIRKTLGQVCRAWKTFLDDAKYRDRWIRLLLGTNSDDRSYSTWDLPSRIDFDLRRIATRNVQSHIDATDTLVDWFRTWKSIQSLGGGGMRLVRLGMPTISARTFDPIFEAFCEASEALRLLRSLTITLPSYNTWVLDALSKRFPRLTHLSLGTRFEDITAAVNPGTMGSQSVVNQTPRPDFTFSLAYLEVLSLLPTPGCFSITFWDMPRLHTFAINPLPNDWKTNIYPFLQRHGKRIESLDLEALNYAELPVGSTPKEVILPIEFWEDFDCLKLLRIDIRYTVFPGISKTGHPLRWLVDTNPVADMENAKPLEQRAGDPEPEGSQVLEPYQQYIQNLSISDLGHATRGFLQTLKLNRANMITSD